MANDSSTPSAQESLNAEEDDSTQPLSPPGVERQDILQCFDREDVSDDDYNGNSSNVDTDGKSTLSDATERTGESIPIEMPIKNNQVTWKDINNQVQSENNLHLGIFLDTSANTALFRLHGDVYLTDCKTIGSKRAIYLFIHPEDIQNITLEASTDVPPMNVLCFTMQRTPRLVIPKNEILQLKPKTESLLRSIQALAAVTSFNVQLNSHGMTSSTRTHLEHVASIFSPNHNIRVDARRANLNTLYVGKGGEIVDPSTATTSLEADPPSYTEAVVVSNKRKRKRKRKILDIQNDQSLATHHHVPFMPPNIFACFINISNRLDHLHSLLDGMNSRLERLENLVADALGADPGACCYGTEERADMLAEVYRLVDDGIVSIKMECEDTTKETLKELQNTFNQASEQLRNEATERIRETEEHTEHTEQQVSKYVGNEL
ncbi:hypothetical protein V8C37DRAFT_381842 [Trichoderma ceciliae]